MRDKPYQPPKRQDGPPYTGSPSLGDLVRAGERLAVSCLFCRHFVWMGPPEIRELSKRLGDDFPTPDLPRHAGLTKLLSCPADGGFMHSPAACSLIEVRNSQVAL